MSKERLCSDSEMTDGEAKLFTVGEHTLALTKIGEEYFCIDDVCTHEDYSLSEGEVDKYDQTLECPKHGSVFDLNTGVPLSLPATQPANLYKVSLEGGDVYVELPE